MKGLIVYTLIMVLVIWYGDASYGGPIVKDGFKTEAACLAYAAKIKASIAPSYERPLSPDTKNRFDQITCIKMDQ